MVSKRIFYVVTCWLLCVECSRSNVSQIHQRYPTINEGDPCVKGKMYKMSCNTCHCADNNALYCTKMACLNNDDITRFNLIKKPSLPKIMREGTKETKEYAKEEETYLPQLSRNTCVPGKLYAKGCQKCFCDETGKPWCKPSSIKCDELPKIKDVSAPNDVRPPLPEDKIWSLPILPHSAAKCEPGKTYMVHCNECLCLQNGNLLCQKFLCLNQDDENAAMAKKSSGERCKAKGAPMSNRCVRCDCVDGITQCNAVPGCVLPKILKLQGKKKTRLSLDVTSEKCDPGAAYKLDCNHCFCPPDQTLMCTKKFCLNFRQTLQLKRQRSYLESHGL